MAGPQDPRPGVPGARVAPESAPTNARPLAPGLACMSDHLLVGKRAAADHEHALHDRQRPRTHLSQHSAHGHLDHHAHLSAQLQLAGELHPGANGLLQGPLPLSVDASPAALGGLAAGHDVHHHPHMHPQHQQHPHQHQHPHHQPHHQQHPHQLGPPLQQTGSQGTSSTQKKRVHKPVSATTEQNWLSTYEWAYATDQVTEEGFRRFRCTICHKHKQVGEFAKDTGAVCSDGNRFKEHVNSKQHKRAVAKEQELMGIPVSDDAAHLLQDTPKRGPMGFMDPSGSLDLPRHSSEAASIRALLSSLHSNQTQLSNQVSKLVAERPPYPQGPLPEGMTPGLLASADWAALNQAAGFPPHYMTVRLLETGAMQPCEEVPIGAFPWTDAPEEQQVHNCIAHLANLFCGEIHGWLMQDAASQPGLLDAHSLGVEYEGATTAALLSRCALSNGLPQAGMRLLFLVRQHPAGPDVEACIKNTLLANLLSAPLRPFTILTDLVDDWRFYWVQRSGVWAYKATSRATAIGLVADMVRWERILDPLEVAQPVEGHIHPPIFYRIRLGMPSEGQEQHL